MKTRTLAILLISFCIILPGSVLSTPSCDNYHVQLMGNPVHTAVAGDEKGIAVGGTRGTIGLIADNGSPLWVYKMEENITDVAISRDGRFVAASTFNGDLFYFTDKGTLLWNRSGFGCDSHVALSGDGQAGYVFSRDPKNDPTGDTVFQFTSNGSVLSHLPIPFFSSHAVSSDGLRAVVGSGGSYDRNYLVAIDNAGIQWEKKIPGRWSIPGVALSYDGGTVAAIEPGSLTAFSGSGRTLWNVSPKYSAKSVAVSGDGQYVALGTQYRIIYFTRSGSQLWEYSLQDYVTHLRVSKNGTGIAATTPKTLYYLDGNGTNVWQYPLRDWPESLSMSETGELVAVGLYNNTFTVLDGTGNATEIDLDTIPVRPIGTAGSGSPVNSSAVPTRSKPAPFNPLLAVIAVGSAGIFLSGGRFP